MGADEPSAVETLILRQMDMFERNMNRRFDSQDVVIAEVKRHMNDSETHREAEHEKLHDRITVLEQAKAHARGVVFAFRWVPQFVTAILGAGLTILIMALSGGIKFH